jgi:hypothetical protein
MKIYFAGGPTSSPVFLRSCGVEHKLYSFANDKSAIAKWGSQGLMLDSGAFSVFTGKARVDIDDLIKYIQALNPEVAIQLDVINDDKKTWQNYIYMKKHLPNILPVIHFRASEEHIKQVIKSSDYILLGGLVPLTRRKKVLFSWLDHLYGTYKLQHRKIHLLGITTKPVLERYPAYSVDSTSWLSANRYPSQDNLERIKQKSKDYKQLERKAIKRTLELQKYITNLWTSRGITWN